MKRIIIAVLTSLAVMSAAVTAFGLNGGVRGGGSCDGTNCIGSATLCSGDIETIGGTVVSYGMTGLVIDTGTSTELFYGLGPAWYWERNNIDRPEVGEYVTLETEAVTIGTTNRQVIISITVADDQPLVLRDSTTCLPLWRGQR